jgi:hypothetical protein
MRLRHLVPILFATVCWGADPAPLPVAEVRLADGGALIEHWKAGPLHRAWQDPAVQRLHPHLERAAEKSRSELGVDPLEVLAALRDASLTVESAGSDATLPAVRAQAALGRFAAAVLAKAREEGAQPAQAAGSDEAVSQEQVTLARFGEALVLAFNHPATAPAAPAPATADLAASVHWQGVIAVIRSLAAKAGKDDTEIAGLDKAFAQLLEHGNTHARYELRLVPEGILERFVMDSAWNPSGKPVDRALLERLPANTLMMLAGGFDGAGYWSMVKDQYAAGKEAAVLAMIDQALAGAGVTAGTADLVQSINGTLLLALTPGMPAPGITIAIPRSPALDQAVEAGLAKIQAQAPVEGDSALIPLPPQIPVALNLARAPGHWVLSTDLGLLQGWLAGTPGGWTGSATAKLALAKAPPEATVIGASDTPAVLRTIGGFLGMGLAMAEGLEPADKQAILTLVQKLAANASPGYLYSSPVGKEMVTEGRGVLGVAAGPMLAAGVVAGAVMGGRAAARMARGGRSDAPDEDIAVRTLKSAIFPAEVQFQAGGYVDQDGDGRGEYGFLGELGGAATVAKGKTLKLLDADVASGGKQGWSFTVYLPDSDGAIAEEPEEDQERSAMPAAADRQERRFVAYAWPAESEHGRMFALTQDGALYVAPFTGEEPAFDALFGGEGWDAVPTWDKHQATPKAKPAPPAKPVPAPAPAKAEPLM